MATVPGTVTITGAQGQGKGTVTASLPASLPVINCPGPTTLKCLGPATVTITHTLAGFGRFLIATSQDGVKLVKLGNTFVQQCPVPQTTAATFTCDFDYLPYNESGSPYSTKIRFDILTTNNNFVEANYIVDFQWGPASSCTAPATAEGQAKTSRQADACQPVTISPSVATNSLSAPYAQRGIAGALRATIRGSNLPTSGTVSLGSDFVVDRAEFKSSTEIEVLLSGFGDLKEGPRDVVITGPSGGKITGKDAFFVSSLAISLEINQGVPMTCDLKRPCLADHNTVVRVRIECNRPKANSEGCEQGKERVTGRLNLFKNGTLFALSPFKPKKRLRVNGGGGYFETTRQAGKDALNFFFTLGNIGLLQEGLFSFEFQIDPRKPDVFPETVASGDLLSTSALTSDGSSVLSFRKSTKPPDHDPRGRTRVSTPAGGVRIGLFVDPADRAKVTDAQLLQWVEFVRATYPASRDSIQAEVFPTGVRWQGQEPADKIEDATLGLVEAGIKLGLYGRPSPRKAGTPNSPYTHLMYFSTSPLDNGWSQCGPGSLFGNLNVGPDLFRCWGMGSVILLQEVAGKVVDDTMRTLAHELGHHYWFGDTYTAAGFQRNPKLPEQNAGVCDYGDGCAVEDGHMDTMLGTVSVRPFANDLAERRKIVKRDFMGNSDRPFRWVNLFNWNYLYPQFNELPQAPGTNSAPKGARSIGLPADPEAVDFIEVRGWLSQTDAVKFLPALRGNGILPGPSAAEAELPPAAYTVEIQDGSGQTLAADGFDPIFRAVHRATPMGQATFDVTLRLYPGSARIVVKKQGVVVATRNITPNPPIVQIVSPSPGATLSGVTKVLWTGADIDSDPLTYSVLYSADGGESWIPLAVDLSSSEFEFDTALVPGGQNGSILVIANDGANSANAVAGSLNLPSKAPQVAVLAPSDGEIFEVGETITIHAPVLDRQGGEAGGTKVVLKSDRDGVLGDGPILSTKQLSVGRHRLVATATNSAGMSAESGITIVVASAADSTAESPGTLPVGGGTGGGTESGSSTKITPLTARGWPNERNFNNPPPNAVDGNTGTFTWTTNPNNTLFPSYFGVDFGSAKSVSRIRLFKDNDGGGGTLSDFFKNLTIEYTTTGASTAMESRTWTRVTGLANGFNGTELLTAVAVNSDGTVTRDSHSSFTSGWASLTFNAVNATGLRIGFSNVTNPTFFNHFKIHEFEAYGPAASGGTGAGAGSATLQFSLNGIDAGGRVNFLSVNVRTTSTVTLTARNPGTSAVTVNSILSDNPVFSADPLTFTLQPNATGPLNVRFSPATEGFQQGLLTLNLAGGGTVTLNVSGSGAAASGGGGGGTGGTAVGPNLLQNGGGDATSVSGCTVLASIFGWNTDGRVGICSYNAGSGYPAPTDPGPPNRGANFFWGGGSAASSMNQVVSLASNATQIDAGTLPFTVSAYLGGYAGDQDAAKVTLTFLNQGGSAVGSSVTLGPVTPTDRAGKTGLFLRTNSGNVPAGARSARVTVDFNRVNGDSNDGYTDDISFAVGNGGGGGGNGGNPGAACPSTTNIALGKPASQSSTAFNGPASAGNNGILEPDYGFHTGEEINPYWQVYLGQASTICQLRLFNRIDAGFIDRARSIGVQASDDGVTFRTVYSHDNSIWGAGGSPLAPAIAPFTARYVRLRLEANARLYFHLREVEIYGFAGASGGGSGGGALGPGMEILQVDGGTFQLSTGFNQGGVQGYFVNRLTPASYPATLRKVLIQFPASGAPLNGLLLGSAIQVVSASTAGSGARLSNVPLALTNTTVTAFNNFVEFDVPALTVQSGGSFLVGFTVLNPQGVYPALVDVSSQSAARSYVGNDGTNFFLYDSLPGIRPGNFAIRARVDYGSGGGGNTGGGTSTRVTANAAAGWPNGRASNNLPDNAIDGNTSTFTWTTESFNSVSPSYLGIGFAAATSVNRIRLYKDNDAGGPGLIAKNLTIEYTTSASSTPLSQRTWIVVSGLTNGFQGAEPLVATSVNSNGTVTADNHDSLKIGWASLSFDAVNATGVRIGFSNATPISVNHYRVYEFEAYGSGGSGR